MPLSIHKTIYPWATAQQLNDILLLLLFKPFFFTNCLAPRQVGERKIIFVKKLPCWIVKIRNMTMEPAPHQGSFSSPHHNISKHINSKCNNSNKTWNVWVQATRKGKEINLKKGSCQWQSLLLVHMKWWGVKQILSPKKITYKIPTFGLKDHIHYPKRTWMHPYVRMPTHIRTYVSFGNFKMESSCIWFSGAYGLSNSKCFTGFKVGVRSVLKSFYGEFC